MIPKDERNEAFQFNSVTKMRIGFNVDPSVLQMKLPPSNVVDTDTPAHLPGRDHHGGRTQIFRS